jgi:hypothetical protein
MISKVPSPQVSIDLIAEQGWPMVFASRSTFIPDPTLWFDSACVFPDIFAGQVVRLPRDDGYLETGQGGGLWAHLQTQRRALAQATFSVEPFREKMAELIDG